MQKPGSRKSFGLTFIFVTLYLNPEGKRIRLFFKLFSSVFKSSATACPHAFTGDFAPSGPSDKKTSLGPPNHENEGFEPKLNGYNH